MLDNKGSSEGGGSYSAPAASNDTPSNAGSNAGGNWEPKGENSFATEAGKVQAVPTEE